MADPVDRLVLVKDASSLPRHLKHTDAIDQLAATSKLVVLLSHGNKYHLPVGWTLPSNVRLLEYNLEDVTSITITVVRLREILRAYGADLHSRHLDAKEALPIPLAGATIVLREGRELVFLNGETDFPKTQTTPTTETLTDWDIL